LRDGASRLVVHELLTELRFPRRPPFLAQDLVVRYYRLGVLSLAGLCLAGVFAVEKARSRAERLARLELPLDFFLPGSHFLRVEIVCSLHLVELRLRDLLWFGLLFLLLDPSSPELVESEHLVHQLRWLRVLVGQTR
jgi:hypothetical protein